MLKVPSQISKITTLSDGGLRLQVDTAELDFVDKSELMGLHNKAGWFVFSDIGIKETDIPTEKIEFKGDKTQGQRLRGVIYRLWEKDSAGYSEFELFYKAKTEKIIDWLKEKLN